MKLEDMDNRLLDYIDGTCTAAETGTISRLLETDKVWQQRYRELAALDQQLRSAELLHPSMRFAKNIMEEIDKLPAPPAAKSPVSFILIKGIAAGLLLAIAVITIYAFSTATWHTGDNSFIDTLAGYFKIGNSAVHCIVIINILFLLLLGDRFLRLSKQ